MESVSYLTNNTPIKINFLSNEDEDEDTSFFKGNSNNPEFTTCHSLPKNNEKSIRSELETLDLSLDVINMADSIFQKMHTRTRRGQKRKQLIFFCVRSAYDNLKIVKDPYELADICEIDHSEITEAFSMCSPVQTGYTPQIIVYSPVQYIPIIFTRVQNALQAGVKFPEDTLDQIIEIANEIISVDKDGQNSLLDEKPQMVAAAIVLYYIEINGIILDRKMYKELFNTTYSTITKLKSQVEEAYNK